MVAFCDALIFLSLTLLAVIVAIFVLAVSFLGRAIEQSSEEDRRIAEEQAEELDKTIQEAQKKLRKARASGKIDEARKELERYEGKKKDFEKRRAKALARYRLLTARQGILYPGVVLLPSIAFAAAARHLTTVSGQYALGFSYALLILAAAGVGWVGYRAYRSLMVVQSVATIPEEVQLKRTVEAFEKAMERHEEKRRPRLKLEFRDGKPPFTFKFGSEEVIRFGVSLEQGDVARSAELWVFAPEGFEFPESETWYQTEMYTSLPNALTTKFRLGDLLSGTTSRRSLIIKTPSTLGTYTCGYSLSCEGFYSGFVPFEVEIAE